MKYRFLGKRKFLWFIISFIIMIPGIFALIMWRLPLGLDFKGGTQFELVFDKSQSETDLRTKISGYEGVQGLQVSNSGTNSYVFRVLPITQDQYVKIQDKLKTDFGTFTERQFQTVQPTVSSDLTRKAILAVVLASVMIIFYLAYSFRGVTHPTSSWQFGTTAVIALLHDLIISVGTFALLAHFLHFEIDASFIVALLTIMGFSVHDSIVVFDRVRENLISRKHLKSYNFEQVVDESLSQTLNRSLATSLTVIFTLLALVVLGGESIRGFVTTLLIGMVIGTYSSIFTASPLLAVWQNYKQKRTEKTIAKTAS